MRPKRSILIIDTRPPRQLDQIGVSQPPPPPRSSKPRTRLSVVPFTIECRRNEVPVRKERAAGFPAAAWGNTQVRVHPKLNYSAESGAGLIDIILFALEDTAVYERAWYRAEMQLEPRVQLETGVLTAYPLSRTKRTTSKLSREGKTGRRTPLSSRVSCTSRHFPTNNNNRQRSVHSPRDYNCEPTLGVRVTGENSRYAANNQTKFTSSFNREISRPRCPRSDSLDSLRLARRSTKRESIHAGDVSLVYRNTDP